MLRTLLEWFRSDNASVQYEVQRMTAGGGWRNFYKEFSEDDATAAFDEPQEQPDLGADTGYPPGRYRCIERRDGRLNEILWTAETPDAEEVYDRQREQERQRERLEELSYEELLDALMRAEFVGDLDPEEITAALKAKRPVPEETDEDSSDPVDRALGEFLQQDEISDEDMERLEFAVEQKVQLESASGGLCYRCQSGSNVEQCSECGDLVCDDHRLPDREICMECADQ